MTRLATAAVLSLVAFLRCGASQPPAEAGGGNTFPPDAGASTPFPDAGVPAPGWMTAYREDFEALAAPTAVWQPDPRPDDGPFSDEGLFFRRQGIEPPRAYRAAVPFGASAWLTVESYTRSAAAAFADRFAVVQDPADPSNRALRLASPVHTDATVIRPSKPLPARYRVSLRVGFADFGDGNPGLNGYRGGETAEPWLPDDATTQNGFYWLAILDAVPRPHNNVWIHHHRKVVIDSDNNVPPWTEIFDGSSFRSDGRRPLTMFALDGRQDPHDLYGPPFIAWSAGQWQPSGAIRAVDSYLPGEWYRASIERDGSRYTLEVSGRFQHGGQTTYRASIDAAANCVWHYNRTPQEGSPACANPRFPAALGPGHPYWPLDEGWPDWFMFGDPHENFYTGSVLYDDVQLEVWE
jgi:hypothetical protein